MKPVYNYNEETGEYIGIEFAPVDPLEEGRFIDPAHSTNLEPLAKVEGKAVCFNGISWEIKSDFRGLKQINLETGQVEDITDIGDLPEGFELYTEEQVDEEVITD